MRNVRTVTRVLLAVALAAAALLALLAAAGCSSQGAGASKPATGAGAASEAATAAAAVFPVTITDDASRSVTIARQPARVVSLAPANTEIVTAIGVPLSRLVGVTTLDDYPATVKALPKVGDFANPNIEAITAAKPDLILITGGVQGDVLAKLENTGAQVVVVDPQTLDELFASIATVGKATGEVAGADKVVAGMKAALAAIAARIGTAAPATAFMEVGYNPIYTAGPGTLTEDLIKAAGGVNVVKQSGYVPYSAEQLLKDDPAVYFAMKGTESDPGVIDKRPGYAQLSAVKNGRVVVLEDNLVARPGPRIVLGIEAMARALHPDAFK
jgi:iron complex transport system substrate-binding protein